ncbi:phosphatase, putative [Plasmodium relictum]|uniref:Phosphatase, putative n=1 Tax=Plasmodium relictum TaxID=85471 RepID=A0A1J1H909_PLARL|nr:phosphatase, putative [Plasmodium relictum]CRH01278.1 phosphatase, putative [Plasmodium relictum]
MNITNFVLIFFTYIFLKKATRDNINHNTFVLNYKTNGLLKRNVLEKENNEIEDEEKKKKEYEEYIVNKGTDEFEKLNYKYMDYVSFSIIKSKNKFKHALNEFLVFLGAQYKDDEKIVVYVRLIDVLSLLFIHFKDNLSNFDHFINSFQDRNKFFNLIETEYFKEFIDEKNYFVFTLKNAYFRINSVNNEKKQILSKKKKIYEIFLSNWKNDGYCFYDVNDKKSSYLPKIVDPNNPCKSSKGNCKILKNVNLTCAPTKGKHKNLNSEVTKIHSSSVDESTNTKENEIIKKDSGNNGNIEDSLMIEPNTNNTCGISENKETIENKKVQVSSEVYYKMKKSFFLNGNPLNIIELINYITTNHSNEVVSKLYEGLKELGIVTFEHIVRYTNIIGIFFSYDIFDELYLQIKLIKEFFKIEENINKNVPDTENTEKKKKIYYGKYEMSEEDTFLPPNCLTTYCKLKSVWMQNRNFTVKIEKSNTNSINFMTVGDIGYGFDKEKGVSLENFLSFFGFNELKNTADNMQKWHAENKADFVVNLGDNIPKNEFQDHNDSYEWHKLIKKLFVFKKTNELQFNNSQENQPSYAKSIVDFYSEKLKGVIYKDKNKDNPNKNKNSEYADDNENYYNSFIESHNSFYDNDEVIDESFEAIPFYSILGEKDYFSFPSEQIQEHYSDKIPGYFMPNNYYSVNYEFTFNSLQDNEINSNEKFKASFIFIDTWSLMIGFPIIRSYRSFREQFNWLSKTLYESAKESDWIFVFGHHPLISSGRRSDNFSYEEHSFNEIIRDFLFTYKVDGYFSAHDHLMEYIKYGKLNLFINGSSSRIIFDDSKMSRGFFGKIIGKLYPVSCYVLKKIHRGLKPKGCSINRYTKWYNKSDIGFSIHKLTKKEFVTEFINGRNGKPLSHKIVIKNKKDERKKFYDLEGYADDRIKELELKIQEFVSKNPDLVKYKIKEFEENNEKYNLILNKLKTEEEKNIFNQLLFLNNLVFDISEYTTNLPISTLGTMYEMVDKYKIFFNKELHKYIHSSLEKAIQQENSRVNVSGEEENDEIEEKGQDSYVDDDASKLIESLGVDPGILVENYEKMTSEQKEFLQKQVGNDIILEDYINKIKLYLKRKVEMEENKKNNELEQTELKTKEEKEDGEEEEEEQEQQKEQGEEPQEQEQQGQQEQGQQGQQGQQEQQEQGQQKVKEEEKEGTNKEEPMLEKETYKQFRNLVVKESKLSNQNYILLMLGSLKIYDENKYSLNIELEKKIIKEVTSSNFIMNIEPKKTFFHLCIELAPEIKRVANNLGGVGKKKLFFHLINKLHAEIMKLKDELQKISI